GIVAYVFVLYLIVFQQIAYDAAQEDNVGPGPDGRVEVGHGRGTGKAWIDHNQLGFVVRLGFGDPLESAGVRLGRVAAHDENNIRVLDVAPMVRHRCPAKRRGKTCHRRAVSDTRLVIECEPAETAEYLVGDVGDFVGTGRRRQHAGRQP